MNYIQTVSKGMNSANSITCINRNFLNYHDFLETCKAEKMDCGARSPGDGYFLGKRNCCDGLTCISYFGGDGKCEIGKIE